MSTDLLSLSRDAEALAKRFHETYERLAPQYAYKTQASSAVDWAEVPQNNKRLMIAVCAEILAENTPCSATRSVGSN